VSAISVHLTFRESDRLLEEVFTICNKQKSESQRQRLAQAAFNGLSLALTPAQKAALGMCEKKP
jgi:hypothetical protein